jgi:hypothetical protein
MGIFLADIEEAERMVPINPAKIVVPLSPAMAAIKTMTSHYFKQESIMKHVIEKPESPKKQKVIIEEIGNTL